MKIEVDREVCIASGQCYLAAPAVFDTDEETGTVVLLEAEPGEDQHAAVLGAEQMCPSQAIRVAAT